MKNVLFVLLMLLSVSVVAQGADEILIPRFVLDQAEGLRPDLKSDARFDVESFTEGGLPENIVAWDFNEDGCLDLIVAAVDKYAKSGRSLQVWKFVDMTASGMPVYINCTVQFEGRYEVPQVIQALIDGE